MKKLCNNWLALKDSKPKKKIIWRILKWTINVLIWVWRIMKFFDGDGAD